MCSNLVEVAPNQYEDPITLELIPSNRIVHLTYEGHSFCYDALSLLKYITIEQQEGRRARLPDNNLLLSRDGVAYVREVARSSFPTRYRIVGLGFLNSNIIYPSFPTREEAEYYITLLPPDYYRVVEVAHTTDPEELFLLYPFGPNPQEATLSNNYFDIPAMEMRKAWLQRGVGSSQPNDDLLFGDDLYRMYRRGVWRWLGRDPDLAGGDSTNLFYTDLSRPATYLSNETLRELEEDNWVVDYSATPDLSPLEIGDRIIYFDVEYGYPDCPTDPDGCPEDLLKEALAIRPLRFINNLTPYDELRGADYEAVYKPEEGQFYCRNLDFYEDFSPCENLPYLLSENRRRLNRAIEQVLEREEQRQVNEGEAE